MDVGTHLATGLVISTFFHDPVAKNACVIGSVLIDVTMIPIYMHRFAINKDWKVWHYLGHEKHEPPPKKFMNVYYFFHSFVFVIALFLTAWYFGDMAVFAFGLGVLSHILWDIPTHRKEWANRPFYPFLELSIEGHGNWWKKPKYMGTMMILWAILFTAYFLLS